MAEADSYAADCEPAGENRRTFLSVASSVAMAGGLISGYGCLAYMAGRFLYPSEPRRLTWFFVSEAEKLKQDELFRFKTPAGQEVTITRVAAGADASAFLALSTVCPHLGCQVHWEPQHNRFFCPCHNGAFDPSGQPTAGPPAEAKQSLPQFALKVENGLLFVLAPETQLG